jgi:hypothetical protein
MAIKKKNVKIKNRILYEIKAPSKQKVRYENHSLVFSIRITLIILK